MDIDAMIAMATADLAAAEAQYRAAQERMKELETIRDGLTLAKQRYGPTQASAPAVSMEAEGGGTAGPDSEMTQTDRVEGAMKGFVGIATVGEIRERLVAEGHDLSHDQVRNALGYLLRKKRVVRPAPGQWLLPPKDFAPAAETAGASKAGENGHSSQADVLTGADLIPQPAG
jgi:hypothetical protein